MRIVGSLLDLELIELVKAGNHAAFTEIYNRYWDSMYIHSLRMLGDEDEAKDIVQELFTTLWTKCQTIDIKTNFSGYLYTVLRYKILNTIRQRKHTDKFTSQLAVYISTHENSPIESLHEKELASALEKEITKLPAKMRQIFEMSRKQYLSHKEIAIELDISDKTVKKQINNALKLVRFKLNNTSITLAFCFILIGGILLGARLLNFPILL